MHENLVEGKTYKVRLKPLEELLEDFPEELLYDADKDLWEC